MTPGRGLAAAGLALVAAVLAWLLFIGLPRWYDAPVATRIARRWTPQ